MSTNNIELEMSAPGVAVTGLMPSDNIPEGKSVVVAKASTSEYDIEGMAGESLRVFHIHSQILSSRPLNLS